MKPSDYRLKSYKTSQNNFYNGSLPLAYLHHLNDELSVADIHRAQLTAIRTHCLSVKNLSLLHNLNADILHFKTVSRGFNINRDTIVNNINNKLNNILDSYLINRPVVNTTAATQQEIDQAILNANSLLAQYSDLLNYIYTHSYYSTEIITQLKKFDAALYRLENAINSYTGATGNKQIHGIFWFLYDSLTRLKGIQLEEDVVRTAENWLPSNMHIVRAGQIYVNGQQSKLDNAVFSDAIMRNLTIQYQRAPVGQSKNKITKQGTLFDFFNDISTSRQQSFYLDEATYATICQHALATVQAKAMSSRSGKMFFGQEQLFNSHSKTVTSGIMNKQQKFIGHTYTLSTIQLAYKQYSTLLLQAIVSMRDLYELVNAESSSQARRYKSTAAAGKKYMTFINYSLYKMIPKILGNNQFLLSNKYGLISFADFFAAESQAYFSWSSRKQVSLHELETYNFNIFLNTR